MFFTRSDAIKLIKSIKRNIRCVTLTGMEYIENKNNITDLHFTFCFGDVSTLRFEMYKYYKCGYTENNPDIEKEGIYTEFLYQDFNKQSITLHFTLGQINDEDDDSNEEEINQYIPDWF